MRACCICLRRCRSRRPTCCRSRSSATSRISPACIPERSRQAGSVSARGQDERSGHCLDPRGRAHPGRQESRSGHGPPVRAGRHRDGDGQLPAITRRVASRARRGRRGLVLVGEEAHRRVRRRSKQGVSGRPLRGRVPGAAARDRRALLETARTLRTRRARCRADQRVLLGGKRRRRTRSSENRLGNRSKSVGGRVAGASSAREPAADADHLRRPRRAVAPAAEHRHGAGAEGGRQSAGRSRADCRWTHMGIWRAMAAEGDPTSARVIEFVKAEAARSK